MSSHPGAPTPMENGADAVGVTPGTRDGETEVLGEAEDCKNPTEVEMTQLVMPCHANHLGELSTGQMLKWMDVTACLSAERHAGLLCVTASMDDFQVEEAIKNTNQAGGAVKHGVGQAVYIKAQVNRAFNTSMEVGIDVRVEDLSTGNQKLVCMAHSTFVARSLSGEKVQLQALIPRTSEERLQHTLAAERRRMRLAHADTILELVHGCSFQDVTLGPNVDYGKELVPAERTRVHSVELVLPPHANHQGNTFGGQIMAWMEAVATISASRLCRAHATLRDIDMFQFRGPSQVGDRLTLKSIVNNAFRKSMEVGVCVEAYRQGDCSPASLRHINSAFMTFVVLDDNGDPRTLPRIKPYAGDGERRYREAIARKKIRLDRKYILSCKQNEVPLSVPWDPSNQVYLSFNNVLALTLLASRGAWELVSVQNGIKLYSCEEGGLLSFRIEMRACVSAEQAFLLLSDLQHRAAWDKHYQKCSLIQAADEDDAIYSVESLAIRKGLRPQDFVVLMSRRRPCQSSRDPYVIAFRSVTLPAAPPSPDFTRSEVLCAGFIVQQLNSSETRISYYNQATPAVLPYISKDIAGLSVESHALFLACKTFLENNSKL
ncbi:acyl-coenzyme A thioesterase 11 isoform X1 [Petromyzon marinus]|uniref:Acyl-coenzyme A thioesterase 11 isoform X1 n=1 Tax=Petromyzon marinus TaxID=7757 RepID=A0AAJ7X529_PETMA|nr:acyl-coenzyme A thioesterase 11 isoform X1 [Petromyzon marinus]XP_032821824.1 acyl-coenzyme A thioesterase 11 isoform X1 [Petromyzon marinus]